LIIDSKLFNFSALHRVKAGRRGDEIHHRRYNQRDRKPWGAVLSGARIADISCGKKGERREERQSTDGRVRRRCQTHTHRACTHAEIHTCTHICMHLTTFRIWQSLLHLPPLSGQKGGGEEQEEETRGIRGSKEEHAETCISDLRDEGETRLLDPFLRFAKLRARVCVHMSVCACMHTCLPQRLSLPLPHMRLMPRLAYALPSPARSP
jgi:hypothetical protein